MKKKDVALDTNAILNHLLKGDDVRAEIENQAVRLTQMANGISGREYEYEMGMGKTRTEATVKPANEQAYFSALKNNTIEKILKQAKK